jgi:Icc-related predicted phosphoesterase
MRIIAISDTHNLHGETEIPEGDVLIHAGDFTEHGTLEEVLEFERFLRKLPHKHKILIAGNHDFYFENFPDEAQKIVSNYIYLQDQALTLNGTKIYGSPWQPRFQDWAFNLSRGAEIRAKWDLIPPDVDVLITHGAPRGIRDNATGYGHIGCEELLKAVERIQPKYHIFGHVHDGYGKSLIGETTFMNVCICDMNYRAANPPMILDI